MCFKGSDGYQTFKDFSPMLNSLTFNNSNNKFTRWASTGISSEKSKLLDSSLALVWSNLGKGRLKIKLNNSVLVQQNLYLQSWSCYYGTSQSFSPGRIRYKQNEP